MFHLKGTGLGSYSTIGNVSLPVSGQTIDSKAYVLGINNNIDIRISNITVDLPYSVNLFAGTKFQIDHDAKLIADANDDNTIASIYLYDLEWSTRDGKGTSTSTKPDGYFGMDEKTIALLSYRPGGFKSPRRKLENDASMLVNGVLEIGEKGALYTTTLGTEGFNYGANIYSTGAGRIKFNNIGTATKVHQAYQDGAENKTLNYFDIPVFALFSDSHLSIIGESLNLSSGTGFAPGITSTDPINELAMLGLLISIVFIALSKEKDEDEMTPIVRQKAFSLSFWITSALYAMVILFVYGISFLNFTFAMPYLFFIMYIAIFNISMCKLRRGEYEK
jgi:hypothetical protein